MRSLERKEEGELKRKEREGGRREERRVGGEKRRGEGGGEEELVERVLVQLVKKKFSPSLPPFDVHCPYLRKKV